MKAISVRAPWWWWILYGQKDIENRGPYFPRTVTGRVWLHVGKWWIKDEIDFDIEDAEAMHRKAHGCEGLLVPGDGWDSLRESCGCIVGSVEIVEYVDHSESPWFVGDIGIVLRNPIALDEPVPFRGMLGFFNVPDDLAGLK